MVATAPFNDNTASYELENLIYQSRIKTHKNGFTKHK